MRDRQTCIDCGKMSPETETNYTLISAQFGWRLSRRKTEDGSFVVEWRCAECWRDHKKKTQPDEPPTQPRPMGDRSRVGAPAPRGTVGGGAGSRSSRPPPRASSKPPPASGQAPGFTRKRP